METITASSTNLKAHGQLTAIVAQYIRTDLTKMGYDVYSDHGSSSKNVGKIVSVIKKEYHREDELSQLDIAIVKQGSKQAAVLVEIEETTDKPKTFICDIFGVLFGKYICFKKDKLIVAGHTTLLIVGINKTDHNKRNENIENRVKRIKTSLGTQNAKIGKVVIRTYKDKEELLMQLPVMLIKMVKAEL